MNRQAQRFAAAYTLASEMRNFLPIAALAFADKLLAMVEATGPVVDEPQDEGIEHLYCDARQAPKLYCYQCREEWLVKERVLRAELVMRPTQVEYDERVRDAERERCIDALSKYQFRGMTGATYSRADLEKLMESKP